MPEPLVSVIIVSWNVRDLLRPCLSSLFRSLDRVKGLPPEIIVVDNASQDGTPEMIKSEFPHARLIESGENLGFTKANNLGIREGSGRFFLLLNPDTELVDDALATMVGYMQAHPRVGALGPRLLDANGKTISSRRRFPTLATAFWESTTLGQWSPHHPLLRRYYLLDKSDEETQRVDWVVGACILLRRQSLEEVGLLDEAFFMYSEELDLCYRLKKRGWEIVYLHQARVVHYGGKSSEQVEAFKHRHFQLSKIMFFRKHHGRLAAESLRIFLLFHYLYQLLIEAAKGLLGHKREMRFQRVAIYWQVLRSGLR